LLDAVGSEAFHKGDELGVFPVQGGFFGARRVPLQAGGVAVFDGDLRGHKELGVDWTDMGLKPGGVVVAVEERVAAEPFMGGGFAAFRLHAGALDQELAAAGIGAFYPGLPGPIGSHLGLPTRAFEVAADVGVDPGLVLHGPTHDRSPQLSTRPRIIR